MMKPSTDTVPAMLTPGEFVIRKDAAEEIGPEKLNMLNNIDRLGQSALLENTRSPVAMQKGGQVGPGKKEMKQLLSELMTSRDKPQATGPMFGKYDIFRPRKPGDSDFVGPISPKQEQELLIQKLLNELGGAQELELRGYQEGGVISGMMGDTAEKYSDLKSLFGGKQRFSDLSDEAFEKTSDQLFDFIRGRRKMDELVAQNPELQGPSGMEIRKEDDKKLLEESLSKVKADYTPTEQAYLKSLPAQEKIARKYNILAEAGLPQKPQPRTNLLPDFSGLDTSMRKPQFVDPRDHTMRDRPYVGAEAGPTETMFSDVAMPNDWTNQFELPETVEDWGPTPEEPRVSWGDLSAYDKLGMMLMGENKWDNLRGKSRRIMSGKESSAQGYDYEIPGVPTLRDVMGFQDGGKVGFEKIASLAKLYREGIGFPVEEGMYTPEGGRTKAGYARQFGVEPESFDIDTVAFRSPSNYALRFVGAEGTPATSAYTEGVDRTSMLPILSDIIGERAKKGKIPAADDFDAMSKYVNERMKQGEMEKVFGQLARQATLEYPKEKQKFQEGGQVMHNEGEGQMKDTLSVFGEKSQDADGLQKLAAIATMQRALDMQKAMGSHGEGMATHTMPDGTVMPGATHQESGSMGMQAGGYIPQYQQGGPVKPPMSGGEEGPQQAPMSSGQQAYHKPPMEQLGMDPFEYDSYLRYGPEMYKYFAQKYKPKTEWTVYDSLVDSGQIDPYEVSKDSINVLTDDQLNELVDKSGIRQ